MKQLLKKAKFIIVFVLAISYLGCEDVASIFPTVTSAFTYTVNEETGTVTFINISEEATTYFWDFGDGDSSVEINPIKSYAASGTYMVTLKASNIAGASDSSQDEVSVVISSGEEEEEEEEEEDCTAETSENIDPANGDINWTFMTDDAAHTIEAFGNTSSSIVANPVTDGINSSCNVEQFNKTAGCETWSGLGTELATALDFAVITNKVFTMKVLAENQTAEVTLRLERLPFPDTEPSQDRVASITEVGVWQEVSFDFSDVTTGTFKSMIIYFERDAECDGDVYYFDDIIQGDGGGTGGGPIAPTVGPDAPTEDSADVISIFSDTYTDVPNGGFNNYGSAAFEQVDLGGNAALKYTFVEGDGGNFQVIELGGDQIDAAAAGMTNFRFDLWFPNELDGSSAFLMKVVDIPGSGATEAPINIDASSTPAIAQGSWLSFDIPITELQANGLGGYSNIQQVVVDLVNSGEVYIDNLYFYKPAAGGGTAPTTSAPVPPARDAADVISIFSDSYTNITGIDYDPNWGQSGHLSVDPAYDPGDGNLAMAYLNFNYQGTDFSGNAQDASAMEFLHVDMWTPDATVVQVTPINGSGTPTESLQDLTPITTGEWNSYDIPLGDYTASGMTLDQIIQLKFDGQAGTTPSNLYLDNIYFYKAPSGGGTAPTTSAPVPPARDAADVISIFSDSYTNITGIDYDPNWGQSGHLSVDPAYDPGDGNLAMAYLNFNYQGTDFSGNAQDASAMEFLHVDMWTPDATVVQVTPINGSGAPTESLQDLTPITTGEWNSYDIPLGDYTASGMTLDQIIQLKFDGQAGTTPSNLYLDNIYFYKAPGGGGTAPTTSAPVPPARDAADVISIYGESYTNITGINYDPNWGQSGHLAVDTAYDPGDGNLAMAYLNFNYQGTDFSGNAQDASAMEFLHIDMWTPDATVVQVTPINGSGAPTESLQDLTPITTGEWNSYDIPLGDYTASGMTLDQIIQLKFDGQAGTTPSNLYLDNIYFYKAPGGGTAPTTSAPVPPARDAADVISIYGEAYTNITGINYDPNWGQSGHLSVDPAFDPGNGNLAMAYLNFNYQGTDFSGNAQDASAMEFLHVDMWTPDATVVQVTPINGSGAPTESLQDLTPINTGAWNSYDIPLGDYTASGMTLDQVIQLKFDGQAGVTPSNLYLDNIYFYKAPATGGNLAANGDFETGMEAPWLLFQNGGTAALDNTVSNGGTWSGRLATGGPSNPAFKQERIGAGTVAATDVVQIQFDHIGSVVQPGAVFNVILFGEGAAGASFTHVFNPAPTLSGSWTTFTATYTIPGGTDVSEGISFLIEAVCGGDAGCSVIANIDNVSVTLNP